jgi:hypothetical protein
MTNPTTLRAGVRPTLSISLSTGQITARAYHPVVLRDGEIIWRGVDSNYASKRNAMLAAEGKVARMEAAEHSAAWHDSRNWPV